MNGTPGPTTSEGRFLGDIFRRLKPLCGKRIDELWIAYQVGTLEDRQAIEEVLTILAVKRLGMVIGDEKIVLEPPKPAVIGGGEYTIGNVVYPGLAPYPFTIHRRELIRHLFLLGPSGTGKSTLIIGLLRQFLRDGLNAWIFDFKRNYRCLLHDPNARDLVVFTVGRTAAPLRVNMLQPPAGVAASEWVEALTDVISTAYLLMQGARNVLKTALLDGINKYGDRATLRDALAFLTGAFGNARGGSRRYGWLESSHRSLEELTKGELGAALNATSPVALGSLLSLPVVFELQALGEDQRKCLCLFLLQAVLLLRKHQEEEREVVRHVLVFDEAHNVFPKDQWGVLGVPSRLAREVREYGEAIISGTQQTDVADSLIANSGIKLILRCDFPKDMDFASKLFHIENKWLPKIPLGQGIARLPTRYYQPFLFSFPEQPLKNQTVTDDLVRERYAQCFPTGTPAPKQSADETAVAVEELTDLARRTLGGTVSGDVILALDAIATDTPGTPSSPTDADERAKALLKDIAVHPISTVTERYARLSWNPKTGNQVKEHLHKDGLVTFTVLPVLKSRVTLLALTPSAVQRLRNDGITVAGSGPGGMEHEFWRYRVKERCEARGWTVTPEFHLGDGRHVDLCAQRDHRRFFIEIETGNSDITANINKCQGHEATLIIFCTTIQTKHAYEQRLPQELIILSPEELPTLHQLLTHQ